MGSEPPIEPPIAATSAASEPSSPRQAPSHRRAVSIAFLVFGLLVAAYLGSQGPQEQHVRIVIGPRAPDVIGVELRYVGSDGEVARSTHFAFPTGKAPRVLSHEPQLPNGEYRLEIDVDLQENGETGAGSGHVGARDGRRGVQRQVTLGGGSTQVDVSTALIREEQPHEAR